MAERFGRRELVFCHACKNEWHRDQSGLECPQCHSDCVEVIDENNDPRDNHIDLTNDNDNRESAFGRSEDALPHHPLHHHNPWADEAPNPEEGDIEHVAFNPAPGVHFQRTTFRSTSPSVQEPNAVDPFAPLFSTFAGMFNGGPQPPGYRSPINPYFPPGHQQGRIHYNQRAFNTNPPVGTPVRANVRVFGAGDQTINSLHAVMQTMLATLQENAVQVNNDPHAQHRGQVEGNPFDLLMQTLTQFRDPARAARGDAVFTDEAMDRIVSQMMEQQGGSGSAPGPASPAAIAALPKRQADKDMVGTDGKAECSVCMDAVLLGDEVAVLPCKHWFHGECVGAWLREHDTCPHCRQGIMPKDNPTESDTPRSSEQSPRHDQTMWSSVSPGITTLQGTARRPPGAGLGSQTPQIRHMPGAWIQPGMQQPYVPGAYPGYLEPQRYVQPSSQAQQTGHPFRLSSSLAPPEGRSQIYSQGTSQGSSTESGNGEGSSGTSPGGRVAGWWRNLRGSGSNEH